MLYPVTVTPSALRGTAVPSAMSVPLVRFSSVPRTYVVCGWSLRSSERSFTAFVQAATPKSTPSAISKVRKPSNKRFFI